MLLEFSVSNYKSFKDECIFSLVPAPKQKGLDYSILAETAGKKTYKGLCSAVVYGPNASGKTNILGAMETFKSIVLRGHIRNAEVKNHPNTAASNLELIPNNDAKGSSPVTFCLRFIEKGMLVTYRLSLDLGVFLATNHARRVLSEQLHINEELVFSRTDTLEIGNLMPIASFLVNAYVPNAEGAKALAMNNLHDQELFLLNGFKTMFSAKLVYLITNWLEKSLLVIYRSDTLNVITSNKQSLYIEKTLKEAAQQFGISANSLAYVSQGSQTEAKLCSLFEGEGKTNAIPIELYESYGTVRFINIFPLVLQALMEGGTLVVDEFDASIHPLALMNIINLFHNDEININHAQLIFNTHNPVFLNSNVFRRDEIKFIERDESTHASTLYALSDFGTVGKEGVRKNQDYMKNYFVDRYGAIKSVDFTPILENLLAGNQEV